MATTTRFPLMKKQIIDSQASGGRCYVRLLPLIPSFKNCDLHQLEDAIITITNVLGRNPKGTNVLAALWHADGVVSNKEDSALGLEVQSMSVPTAFIEELMAKPVRFGFEELGGVMHITYYLEERNQQDDLDSPIETEFGWAPRFIIQQMCNAGRYIGADDDDDLDDLFGSILNSKAPPHQQPFDVPKIRLYSDDTEERETQSKVEDAFNRLEALNEKRQKNRGIDTKNDQKELLQRLMRMEEKMQSILSLKEEKTVLPDDSSSNVGRYEKKFMTMGHVFNPIDESNEEIENDDDLKYSDTNQIYNLNKQGTVLAVEQEIPKLNITKEIVVGFRKTHDMCRVEQKVIKTIHPINGLANPYRSNRLNLLAHFHTAISNVLPNCTRQSYIEMMWYMTKYKSKTPSEELAYQIVSKTFDMEQLKVISNPFRLPFIEIGMQINDPTLVKCFMMLKNEYKHLWFTEMKHLEVPAFHNEFADLREGKMTGLNQTKHHASTEERAGRHKSSSEKLKGYYERPSRKSFKGGTILTLKSEK